jgi:hypothetical protein
MRLVACRRFAGGWAVGCAEGPLRESTPFGASIPDAKTAALSAAFQSARGATAAESESADRVAVTG